MKPNRFFDEEEEDEDELEGYATSSRISHASDRNSEQEMEDYPPTSESKSLVDVPDNTRVFQPEVFNEEFIKPVKIRSRRKLWVNGFPDRTSSEEISQLFGVHNVKFVKLVPSRDPHRRVYNAIIECRNNRVATRLRQKFNHYRYTNKRRLRSILRCEWKRYELSESKHIIVDDDPEIEPIKMYVAEYVNADTLFLREISSASNKDVFDIDMPFERMFALDDEYDKIVVNEKIVLSFDLFFKCVKWTIIKMVKKNARHRDEKENTEMLEYVFEVPFTDIAPGKIMYDAKKRMILIEILGAPKLKSVGWDHSQGGHSSVRHHRETFFPIFYRDGTNGMIKKKRIHKDGIGRFRVFCFEVDRTETAQPFLNSLIKFNFVEEDWNFNFSINTLLKAPLHQLGKFTNRRRSPFTANTIYLIFCCLTNDVFNEYQLTTPLFQLWKRYNNVYLDRFLTFLFERKSGQLLESKLEFNLENRFLHWCEVQGVKSKEEESSLPDFFTIEERKHSQLNRVKRIRITPLRIYFQIPEYDVGNRILREYQKRGLEPNFVRVTFTDECKDDDGKLFASDDAICSRIAKIFKKGITAGKYHFKFLAFSSSQLRNCSVWMFSQANEGPSNMVNVKSLRSKMGTFFTIKNVGKFAARAGQALSTTIQASRIETEEYLTLEDKILRKVESVPVFRQDGRRQEFKKRSVEYNFTDGAGLIDVKFALEVMKDLKLKKNKKLEKAEDIPSAFQFRYAGFKGVVTVYDFNAPYLPEIYRGKKCIFRKSQEKFKSVSKTFEIVRVSNFRPCFLNRQIIAILSTNGIEDEVFIQMARETLKDLKGMLNNIELTKKVLFKYQGEGPMTEILTSAIYSGFDAFSEPFLCRCLHSISAVKRIEFRRKARIYVEKGGSFLGVPDESQKLQYGQCFFQIRRADDDPVYTHKGRCIVVKNPAFFSGDVRVLEAIDVPELRHLYNVFVFPVNGERPHPNEITGSDLDGDQYFVSYDPALIQRASAKPANFEAGAPKIEEVDWEDVKKFFIRFLKNDDLGKIANAHLANYAFSGVKGVNSMKCLELARLHSVAVDFTKTGVPAKIPKWCRPKQYPCFMEKEDTKKTTFAKDCILEKLFAMGGLDRNRFELEQKKIIIDRDILVDGWEKYEKVAKKCFTKYAIELRRISRQYKVGEEADIFTAHVETFIKSHMKSKLRRLQETTNALISRFRRIFQEQGNVNDDGSEIELEEEDQIPDPLEYEEKLKLASAWYYVSYSESKAECLSFPWVICDYVCAIKRKAKNIVTKYKFKRYNHTYLYY